MGTERSLEPRYVLRHCRWCAGKGGWQVGSCPEGSDIDYEECDRCGMLGVQVLMAGKWLNPLDWMDAMRDAIPRMLQVWPAPDYHRGVFDVGHRAMHAVDVPGEEATVDELREVTRGR